MPSSRSSEILEGDVPGDRQPRSRQQRLKVLFRISDLINSTTSSDTLLRRILREAGQALSAPSGFIAFRDAAGVLEIKVSFGEEMAGGLEDLLAAGSTAVRSAEEGEPVIANAQAAKRRKGASGGQSEVAAALRLDGETVGVIALVAYEKEHFSEEDGKFLSAIAGQAARVLHTSQLYNRMSAQAQRFERLLELGQQMIAMEPLPIVLNRVTETLLELMDVKQCTVLLVGEGHDLQLSASSGTAGQYAQRGASLLNRVTADTGERVRVMDVRRPDNRKPGKAPARSQPSTLLSVPVYYREILVAMLNVYTAEPREYTADEMRLLRAYASLCGTAIENSRRYERLASSGEEIRQSDRLSTLSVVGQEVSRQISDSATVISLLFDSLREEGFVPPGRVSDVEQINEQVIRMTEVTDRVAQMGAQRRPHLEYLDLNRVVEDVLMIIGPSLSKQDIMLHKRLAPDLPRVLADRAHMLQVVLHLVSNAKQHMGRGGILNVSSGVVVGYEAEGGAPMVRINIRDTGAGLGLETGEALFDLFDTGREGKAGTGLFVSANLVQMYGGRITARNAADHGASFSLTMPAHEIRS